MELKPMLEENERITGFARAPEVRLQLTDRQPKWVPQYPIVEHHKEIVSEQVQKWLQRGKIRRVSSEWNMPLTTAIKYNKKGEPYGVRVCIDPRVLNTKLVPDNWEIPNIQGLCESFAGMQYYSEIDLEDAFLQLRVRLEDQELLAFTHAGQQYCFVGAPFGLKILIIASRSWEEHSHHLKIVFERMNQMNPTWRRRSMRHELHRPSTASQTLKGHFSWRQTLPGLALELCCTSRTTIN